MAKVLHEWEKRIGRRLRLRDLHILSIVTQQGSMAKAASHLAMSQPAVSESVANLEATLGVRLLDRSSRGVEPTFYAHALLKRGNVVFDELMQAVEEIAFLADPKVGLVRVGSGDTGAAGLLALWNSFARWPDRPAESASGRRVPTVRRFPGIHRAPDESTPSRIVTSTSTQMFSHQARARIPGHDAR